MAIRPHVISLLLTLPLLTTPVHAGERSGTTKASAASLKCEAYNSDEKHYFYGEGKVSHFAVIPPPTHTPISRDHPPVYGANMHLSGKGDVYAGIRGKWVDPDAPLGELQVAPIPVLYEGNTYRFCYRDAPDSNGVDFISIDYSETISLLRKVQK